MKILGIFLVVRGVDVVLSSFSILFYAEGEEMLIYTIVAIGTVAVYFFILWLFVFKTAWLIDKLDLENGFEEERIELKNDFSNILSIAIIVMGGIMVIDSLPQLCKSIFTYYQAQKMFCPWRENPSTGWIILYLVKAIAGYLLMTNSRQIANFINRKSEKNDL